jgi:hypothetical protein
VTGSTCGNRSGAIERRVAEVMAAHGERSAYSEVSGSNGIAVSAACRRGWPAMPAPGLDDGSDQAGPALGRARPRALSGLSAMPRA